MLDNFREWLSDNLRYILLGLAILVVLVIIFLGARAIIGGVSSDKEKEPKQQTEQKKNSVDSEKSEDEKSTSDKENENALEKNAYPEVNTLIESFYKAWEEKDAEKMKELTDKFSATDEAKVSNAGYIESYENIEVYTKKGLDDSSYVVFVSYDLKFKDVETMAPGLSQLYVIKNEKGSYLIHNDESDTEVQECMEKTRQEADVAELISKREKEYDAALAADPKLNEFEEKLGEETNTALMADDGDMLTAGENCNVRLQPNSSSSILGILQPGDQVKKIENAADGWIKVEYNGQEAYVYSDMLR